MAISADIMDIDMAKAAETVESWGYRITQRDEMLLVFQWNDMETTLYPQGKVMFFPLKDKSLCIKYATEILESL